VYRKCKRFFARVLSEVPPGAALFAKSGTHRWTLPTSHAGNPLRKERSV
jgi:hypothetical protein